MLTKLKIVMLTVGLALLSSGAASAGAVKDAENIVSRAEITVDQMLNHEKHGKAIRERMKNAKAVFIAPQVFKGGFFFGGEGGKGILLAKAENGEWSYPAFYYFGAGSFGLQFGAQASELFMIIQTGKGLTAIMENNLKVGGDLSAAVGLQGEGLETGTTTNLKADIMTYSIAKGAFLGASIEGAVIVPDESLNTRFYAEGATSKGIVLEGKHKNTHADNLRNALTKF